MKIPGFDDPKTNTLQLVSDWLSNEDNGPWLMALDNADDVEVWIKPVMQESTKQDGPYRSAPLIDYIPRGSHCFVLITTRDSQLGESLAGFKRERPIEVLPFVSKDAEILLCRKLSENDDISQEDANEITEALDFLPLAITQAAAYLDQNRITAAEYLQLFRDGEADTSELLEQDIHDAGRDYEIQNSVFQTWKISFDQIRKQEPRAAEVLSLMAVLERQGISENMLRKNEERKLKFNAAIQKLKAFSLITEETIPSIFSIHRLVQLSTQRWLDNQNELSRWRAAALSAVAECCPSNGEYENWVTLEAINPHLQVVLDYQFDTKPCQLQRAKILHTLGSYNLGQGRHSIAYQHCSESLALLDSNFGPEHPSTLNSMMNLGLVLQSQGKYEEAEEMHRRVSEVMEKVLGLEHPNTLTSMNNLAVLLANQGRYDKAEEIHRRVLEVKEKVLGPEHPSTLESINKLGLVLRNQGKYEEAEEIHGPALVVMEKVLGPEHPTTLTSTDNFGLVIQCQGKYEEAEEMHRRVSEVTEKVLGPEHPITLIINSMSNLAALLQSQGKYEEAEEMDGQVLVVREKVLGPEHPDTLSTVYGLAKLHQSRKQYDKACILYQRACSGYQARLGSDHPTTLACFKDYLSMLENMKRD
jgi:tetratricopeptide (TPR) repeat protein